MRVIVVEDDRTLAGLIETVAKMRGHDVLSFESVDGVFEAVTLPCILLLDLTLVAGDAPALVREIRDDQRTEAARVILLSGNKDIEEIARDCGADGWLKKPFGLAELESELG